MYVGYKKGREYEILTINLSEFNTSYPVSVILTKLASQSTEIDLYIPRWYNEHIPYPLEFPDDIVINNLIVPGKFEKNISGNINNLYTISSNNLLSKAQNIKYLDTGTRKYIVIDKSNGEFGVYDFCNKATELSHLEVFGTQPCMSTEFSNITVKRLYIEAPIFVLNVSSENTSVVVNAKHLYRISSTYDATIVLIGSEDYKKIQLNLTDGSAL